MACLWMEKKTVYFPNALQVFINRHVTLPLNPPLLEWKLCLEEFLENRGENEEKQGKERVACSQLYLLWCFLTKLNFKCFDLTGFNPVISSLNVNSLTASGLDY